MSESENRVWNWLDDNWFWLLLFGSPALTAAIAYFAQWPAAEIIVMSAVLLAAVVGTLGLVFWRQVRLRQADAALKQALLQRELSVEDIERLVTCQPQPPAPPAPPQEETSPMAQLAACLRASEVSEAVTEQVFTSIRVADPTLRDPICEAICGLGGDGGDEATEEQIRAVLRGLCGNGSATSDKRGHAVA